MTIQKITPGEAQRFGLVRVEPTSTEREMRFSILLPLEKIERAESEPIWFRLPLSEEIVVCGRKIGYFENEEAAENWLDASFERSILA